MTEPLRISLDLDCSVDHAFRTWTQDFARWWPGSHTVAGSGVDVVFQPQLGGRIFECAPDGNETDWGVITRWEPPTGFGYLWHLRRDRSDATDVDIAFVDLGDDRCRLEIVHSGWDRLGGEAPAWREANKGGWAGLLPHFSAAADRPQPPDSQGGSS